MGDRPDSDLSAGGDAELAHDVAEVRLDRAHGHVEKSGDSSPIQLAVGFAFPGDDDLLLRPVRVAKNMVQGTLWVFAQTACGLGAIVLIALLAKY